MEQGSVRMLAQNETLLLFLEEEKIHFCRGPWPPRRVISSKKHVHACLGIPAVNSLWTCMPFPGCDIFISEGSIIDAES